MSSQYAGDESANLSVDDPEEYSNSRRRQRIHTIKERVTDVRLDLAGEPSIRQDAKDRVYYELIKSLVIELETLLSGVDREIEEDYWNGHEIGTITLSPPDECLEFHDSHISHLVPGSEPPAPKEMTIGGLRDFVELNPPLGASWNVAILTREGYHAESFSTTSFVPWSLSDSALRACNRFLSDVGMDLQLNEMAEARFEYSDIFAGEGDE